jgi:hypothetical protein
MWEFVARVRAIMLTPQSEWLAIESEAGKTSAPVWLHVAVLAAVPTVARFLGGSLIGGYMPVVAGLLDAALSYVLAFVLVYLVARVADALAPRFESRRNISRALRLTAYAYTPVWLAGIFLLVPGLSFLNMLGLYGVYLLWLGAPVMMATLPRGLLAYVGVIAATAFALEVLVRIALAAI